MEIRAAAADELLRALAPISHYFGSAGPPTAARLEGVTRVLPDGGMLAALDGETIVGGAGAFSFELTVPGGRVPAAGVTVVAVLPTHRRRGVLRGLMRAQLDGLHERGVPLAVLWASEGGIYGRFGYGLASLCGDLEIPRVHAAYARPVAWEGTSRLVPLDGALEPVSGVYDRVAAETPGMFSRSRAWWEARLLTDPEWRRAGGGEKACAVFEREGRAEGYALYRVNFAYEDGVPTGTTSVVEAMGATPAATAAVWRFLLDVDWMERVQAYHLPLDHPLFLLLLEPGQMRFRLGDCLWLRLVDVGAALAARAPAGADELVVEVADAFCPWNDARFSLDGAKTTAQADLRLDVDALGSAYLGGFTLAQLARAGRVEELRAGSLARADGLFRSERAPWTPEIF
ncbi:MAG TPA: GNAT family N-acetyltransferase [Gaiellaceae bacterium]|nr:GNAT family N-acetyltransferase [Gaiellaceae bacterium]